MQAKIAAERNAALQGLSKILRGHYEHIEPDRVAALLDSVAPFFKKVEDIKQLTADAAMFFPAEFDQAIPKNIKASFLETKKEALEVAGGGDKKTTKN